MKSYSIWSKTISVNGIAFIIKSCDFIRMHMSSSVFEVFAYSVSMIPLALLVFLYYIHMLLEDRQARGYRYPIQDTGGCNPLNLIPQQPCDDV